MINVAPVTLIIRPFRLFSKLVLTIGKHDARATTVCMSMLNVEMSNKNFVE